MKVDHLYLMSAHWVSWVGGEGISLAVLLGWQRWRWWKCRQEAAHTECKLIHHSLYVYYISYRNTSQFLVFQFSSGHSVISNLLRPHGLQHSRLPILHYLLAFVQTHVHWVGDAIQASQLMLPSFPPALSVFPSIRVFSSELAFRIRWLK